MGGARVSIAERPASSSGRSPLATVRDPGGLWSFELHGPRDADAVLVLLPAMGVPSRYYDSFADELLHAGVALVRADFLAATVGRDRPQPLDGFAALVEGCIPAIFAALREHVPDAAPVIVGHSLGGQLGLIAAARYAPEIPVVLVASGSAWHRTLGPARGILYLVGSQTIRGISGLLGRWPGDRLGFGGRQPEAVIRDWSRVVRTGRYAAATGTFDYEEAIAAYRGEVLAIDVAQDVLAPRAATDALLAKALYARVTRLAYITQRGAAKPGAHFTWAGDSGGVAPTIVAWLRSRTA